MNNPLKWIHWVDDIGCEKVVVIKLVLVVVEKTSPNENKWNRYILIKKYNLINKLNGYQMDKHKIQNTIYISIKQCTVVLRIISYLICYYNLSSKYIISTRKTFWRSLIFIDKSNIKDLRLTLSRLLWLTKLISVFTFNCNHMVNCNQHCTVNGVIF